MAARSIYQYDSDNEISNQIVDFTIHDKLTYEQIEEIHNILTNKPLTYDEFRETLETFNMIMSDDQYKKLFLKLNQESNSFVSADEFLTYMIYSYKHDDSHNQKESLILPISMEPVVKNACHKTQIISISLIQSLDDNEEASGSYLTVSKDGHINCWSSDLDITRSGSSKSQYLKYTSTWVLDIVALSDVRVICVSSTERELRFYDVMATSFHLRLIIRSVPYAVCKMDYSFITEQDNINSKLLMGDMNGSVYIIEFSPEFRGPFQSKAGAMLMEFTWHEILKKKLPTMIATEYLNVFKEGITDVKYSYKFDTIYISAEGEGLTGGVLAIDARGIRTHFNMPQGVSTFVIDEQTRILATGGPDSYLRLWDPIISSKASAILTGHHAGIIYIFIQAEENKCYSIDKAKIIKVWDLIDLTLIQTYSDLMTIIPNETTLCYLYNKAGRELLVGGRKLISIKCCLKIKTDLTDGFTHTSAISVVLYNKLFENIVTCGLDSYIIVWDIWTGKRQVIMKGCHTELALGETIDVEITAATFNPDRQFLLTGARNGSLKVWNYNNAVCIRNMNIEKGCEVTSVIWIVDRILVVGWNHRVSEFADTKDRLYTDAKPWYRLHLSDILASAYKVGETLVTGSYGGELILWKIDTGQPYRKYEVARPTDYIPLLIDPKNINITANYKPKRQVLNISKLALHSVSKIIMKKHLAAKEEQPEPVPNSDISFKPPIKKKHIMRRLDSQGILMPLPVPRLESEEIFKVRIGIQAILMLNTRPQSKEHGTILVSLDNGFLQVFSHHQSGGFIKEFYTIHKSGDNCLTLATDKSNKYLFTGTSFGYIKVWLLQNYCIPESEQTHVCMPLLRLKFVFLNKTRILGRAKRVARNNDPLLLNSYKAHLSAITSIIYIEHSKILITGSNDFSVRMWTLGGRYIGTLGGSVPIKKLTRGLRIDEDNESFRIPPDINIVGSSTTMKVLSGKAEDHLTAYIKNTIDAEKLSKLDQFSSIKGSNKFRGIGVNPLKDPILGNHFKFNKCQLSKNAPILDKNLPHIPVYTHLNVNDAINIERPRTPEKLKEIKNIDFMKYYKSNKNDK